MSSKTRLLIVYAATLGNTKRMADAAADGARSVAEIEVILALAEEVDKDAVHRADGLLAGTPVRHRSMDSRVKAFIENTLEVLWLTDEMVGRVGGVFSVGGGYGNQGAGVETRQLGVLSAMAACGMVIVPLPKTTPGFEVAGSHWGAHGRSGGPAMEPVGVTDEMCEAAFHHAANVARLTHLCRDQDIFARGNVAPSEELVRLFTGAAD